jgi:hypothetical protein
MENQGTKMALRLPDAAALRTQQKIAAVAYKFWLARAFQAGSPAEDWLRADQKVRGEVGPVKLRRTTVGNFLL